jgi:hypothetical protein
MRRHQTQFDPLPAMRTPVTVTDDAEIGQLVAITATRPADCLSTAPPTPSGPPGPSIPRCTATSATGTRS